MQLDSKLTSITQAWNLSAGVCGSMKISAESSIVFEEKDKWNVNN